MVVLLSGFYSDNTAFAQTIPFAATYGTTSQINTGCGLGCNINMPSGPPGTQVSFSLKGFLGTTTLYWGNTTVRLDPIATGTSGSITFTIPQTATGYYAVYVSDGVNIAYATVQVT